MEEPEELSLEEELFELRRERNDSKQREKVLDARLERVEKQLKNKKRGRPLSEHTVIAGKLAEHYELIIGTNGQQFAKAINGRDVYPLEESPGRLGFISAISEAYFAQRKQVLDTEVGRKAIKDFVTLCKREALTRIMPVAYRSTLVRENDRYVWYYDRCEIGSPTRFIRVTADDVEYISHIDPILFVTPESAGVAELPQECEIHSLAPLETLTSEQWSGLLFWCAYALLTEGLRVHLVLHGKSGGGKTTVVDWIYASIDPKQGERAEGDLPRTSEDMLIAARNNFLTAYENIDKVPDDKSNTIARMVNNAQINKRELYTSGGLATIAARATCVFTSVEQPISRRDLLRRSWLFKFSESGENSGRSPIELREQFKQEQPKVLGALIKLVQGALSNIDSSPRTGLPQKADFTRWLIAMGKSVGQEAQQMLELVARFEWGGEAGRELSGLPWLVQQLVGAEAEYRASWRQALSDLERLAIVFESSVTIPTDEERLSRALHSMRYELYDHGIVVHPSEHTRYGNVVRLQRLWTADGYDAQSLAQFMEHKRRANGED